MVKKEYGEFVEDGLVATLREYDPKLVLRAVIRHYMEELTFDGDSLHDSDLMGVIEDRLENKPNTLMEEHLIYVLTAYCQQCSYDKANLDAQSAYERDRED